VNSVENKTNEHSELRVALAETAYLTENYSLARELIEEFLLQNPQQDSFFCHAKIILGLLIDHEANSTYGEVNIQQRKFALKELQIALQVAISTENKDRYQFLIFNISIECWKIARQFLRKGRAKFFKEEMGQICQSLETLKDVDKNWLITFMSGTAYCLEDGEDPKKALELLDKALLLAEELVTEANQKETKKREQLTSLSKEIEEVQKLIHIQQDHEQEEKEQPQHQEGQQQGEGDLSERLLTLQRQLAETKNDYKALSEKKVPLQNQVMKLFFQKIYAFPADAKKLLSSPQVQLPPPPPRLSSPLPSPLSGDPIPSHEDPHHNPLDECWHYAS
jgi:tetratricopeptide (TPR) repeat protein